MPRMPVAKRQGVTRIKGALCPHCGYFFDTFGTDDGSAGTPKKGDLNICMNCAALLIFETAAHVRAATPAEQTQLQTDPKWSKARTLQARLLAMQRKGFQTAQAKRGLGRKH